MFRQILSLVFVNMFREMEREREREREDLFYQLIITTGRCYIMAILFSRAMYIPRIPAPVNCINNA